ncbi:predicted protein [Postia placenta Mad-698-R]|nr:predicted protein [Postia placenta Mad-698-R]
MRKPKRFSLPLFQLTILSASLRQVVGAAHSASVTWMSPSVGDVFASGDTIVGQWSSQDGFAQPSFSLCSSSDGDSDDGGENCGADVWPIVNQDSGSYLIYLSTPDISTAARVYLRMDDNSGQTTESPQFSLSPISSNSSTGSLTNPNATSIPLASPSASAASSLQPLPDLASTAMPAPTAAYAVPLSLVVSVLLAACGLAVRQRRKLQQEREQEEQKLKEKTWYERQNEKNDAFTRFPGMRRQRSRLSNPGSVGASEVGMRGGSAESIRSGWGSRASSPTAAMSADGSCRGFPDPHADFHPRPHSKGDDDQLSLYSVASLKRQPMVRRATREAFCARPQTRSDMHTLPRAQAPGRTLGQRRAGRVTASAFRAGVSPVPPVMSRFLSGASEWDYGVRKSSQRRREERVNASVEDEVVECYFMPSPVPPAQPERLHVRRYTADVDKPLPEKPGSEKW